MDYFNNKFYYSILLFNFTLLAFSQEKTLYLQNINIQTGIDITNKNYLVFSGFESFYKKSFQSKEWEKVAYKYNSLPLSKNFPYEYFHVKGKNYLVYKGCGSVYEFRNDSIVRIDNSFEQKNQFDAASFVYNNEIYFFGGYGLFTFKNILTKFDFKTKEWELVKYSNNELPQPRDKTIAFLKKDELYIFSGYTETKNNKQLTENSQQIFDAWKLNLKTKSWDFLGYLDNEAYFKTIKQGSSYLANEKFYSDYNRLISIDIENNSLDLYKPDNKFTISFSEKYNPETKEIIYALPNTNDSNKTVSIIIEPFSKYSGEITESQPLFKSKFKFLLGGVLGFLILIALFVLKRKLKIKNNNRVTFENKTFYYKNKPITNLSNDEKAILILLFKNRENPVQVSELIDVISSEDNTNYNTLSKKKDLVFNSLKQKLGFILEVNENDLFIYSKNEKDKRIKEIQLNKEYFG